MANTIVKEIPVSEIDAVGKPNTTTAAPQNFKPIIDGTRVSKVAKKENSFFKSNCKDIGQYVVKDLVIPYSKKLIWEILSNAISMTLFGEESRTVSSQSRKKNTKSRVSYSKYYDEEDEPRRQVRRRSVYSYDDIKFEDRGEAQEILLAMEDILDRYGMTRVSDMYDLANMTPNNTDYNYGWFNLNKAEVIRDGRSYIIDLPQAVPLK